MSEQLYRWVKASERFPDDPNEKVFRRKRGSVYQYIQTEDFQDQYLIWNDEEIYYRELEWEEPLPLNTGDDTLKEELQNLFYSVSHKDGSHPLTTDLCEQLADESLKLIAGAGYGKGGEEKTFGQLIQSRTKLNVLSPHISDDVWKDLINDTIWTNCIPIRIFQNLLQLLEIPFWLAKETMYQTYEILWTAKQKEKVTLDTRKDLWENKEAFDKYVNRLEELISESSRPSIDIVKQLREANPYTNVTDGVEASRSVVYSKCCDKLEELLKQNQSK